MASGVAPFAENRNSVIPRTWEEGPCVHDDRGSYLFPKMLLEMRLQVSFAKASHPY